MDLENIKFRHSIPIQIRFNDVDTFGHVNNSIYFSFYDLAKTDYFKAVLPDGMNWKDIALVIANINADFISPIYFHENIEVRTAVIHIGHKSLKLRQLAINTVTNEIKCACTTTMVGFNLKTLDSAPIPDSWKEAISMYDTNVEIAK